MNEILKSVYVISIATTKVQRNQLFPPASKQSEQMDVNAL